MYDRGHLVRWNPGSSRGALRPLHAVRGRPLRLLAWGAVAAGIVLPLARRRLRLPAPVSAAAAGAAPFGMAIATRRSGKRDVAVYALQMWAFIVIHELPYDDPERLERRTRVEYPIAADRAAFGTSVNAVLQRSFGRPGTTTTLDHTLAWVHWLWFLQPHSAAAWVLWRHPERFERTALMICSVFDLGVLGYFVVPTAPPWWAAERGRLGSVRRIMAEVGQRQWGRAWPSMYQFLGGNPVAAMPSLHFGSSVMAARMLAEADPRAGALGWAYAGALGFALVYLGEHYTVDLAAGLALAEAVRVAGPRLEPAFGLAARAVRELEARAGA